MQPLILKDSTLEFHPSIEVSGQALYLKTSSSSLNIAGYKSINNLNLYEVAGNNSGFGFQLEGRYHFNTQTDIDLNGYSIDDKFHDVLAGSMTDDAGAHLAGNAIQNTHQAKWRAVNLEVGHSGSAWSTHPFRIHAGFEYTSLEEILRLTTNQGVDSDSIFRSHQIRQRP